MTNVAEIETPAEAKANQAVARFDERRQVRQLAEQSDGQSLLATISRIASDPNADIEKLTKIMDLYDRMRNAQERKAFDAAIAAAKANIQPVGRNKTGHNDKKYADFAAIARAVDPVLSENGLSYRFRTSQTDRIYVTCILSHRDGHCEETTLAGPPDKTGSKNDIQAIGSTLTYLQRYSLVQALGLAAGDDDDGKAAEDGVVITDEQADQIRELIGQTKSNVNIFLEYFKVPSVSDIPAKRFPEVIAKLTAKLERVK